MAKVLISNVDNQYMTGDTSCWNYEYCHQSAMFAARLCWLADDNDIVVLPKKPSDEMINYMKRFKGNGWDNVKFLSPPQQTDYPLPLGPDQLLNEEFVVNLKNLLSPAENWALFPYLYDPSIPVLQNLLGFDHPHASFLSEGGAELLNDKKVYRAIAAGKGICLAQGSSVASCDALFREMNALMPVTGAVIIKQERHSSADGNIIVSELSNISMPGASNFIHVATPGEYKSLAEDIWQRFAHTPHASLVIEVYYQVSKILTAEFQVQSNKVTFLNFSEPRMSPTFSGLLFPAELNVYDAATFIAGATQLACATRDMGYLGRINIDGILTHDGQTIFNEFNGRIGGSSHIHDLCTQIISHDYTNHYHLVTNSKIKVNIRFADLLRKLDESHLSFNSEKKTGVIITAENIAHVGAAEFLFVGRNKAESFSLEEKVKRLLQ